MPTNHRVSSRCSSLTYQRETYEVSTCALTDEANPERAILPPLWITADTCTATPADQQGLPAKRCSSTAIIFDELVVDADNHDGNTTRHAACAIRRNTIHQGHLIEVIRVNPDPRTRRNGAIV